MKKLSWKKFIFEFLSIFIAVISAFALSKWNDNRSDSLSEEKILKEIRNGINLDLKDFEGNTHGHELSLRSIQLFKNLVNDQKAIPKDSTAVLYTVLFRDYAPIINQSGYESLKASGLKTISNDSLRFEIITLYDFYYKIIAKLEEEIDEMKSYANYYQPINTILYPNMSFDNNGQLSSMDFPLKIDENERKELLSYFWRLETNRNYRLKRYELVKSKMVLLKEHIENELKNK